MKSFYLVVFLAFSCRLTAQKAVLLVQSNGQQQVFNSNQPFVDAYNAANNGDTIYLPGGIFVTSNIDKRLAVYGAGHYPDSTNATGKTIVSNSFYLYENADSLLLEGIEFSGNITISADVNHLLLKRNNFTSSVNFSGAPASSSPQIEGNRIGGPLYLTNAANALVTNNIIDGQVSYAKNGDLVRNNTFISESYPVSYSQYARFENNIFTCSNPAFLNNSGYNHFVNNVFTITPNWYSNTVNNNYLDIPVAGLFTNQTGYIFDYAHNYHLQNPGTYTGTDASQCGIYGGSLFIYKEGGVPSNPHIRSKSVSQVTDASGNINVNITVAAQNN